ncbi:MAG: hypothetical protein IKT16_00840, partial [Desulfovibrio sp.]|nr:hypothetical protein [Desulfovibrio sp.]
MEPDKEHPKKSRRGLFALLAAIAFAYASIFLLQHFYGSLLRPSRQHGQDHPVQVHAMDVLLQLHRDNRVTVAERLQV